jgi:hypothetical protein
MMSGLLQAWRGKVLVLIGVGVEGGVLEVGADVHTGSQHWNVFAGDCPPLFEQKLQIDLMCSKLWIEYVLK